MVVDIDETRRHSQPLGVDDGLGAALHLTYGDYLLAPHGDGAPESLSTGPVDDEGVPDEDIVLGHGGLLSVWGINV